MINNNISSLNENINSLNDYHLLISPLNNAKTYQNQGTIRSFPLCITSSNGNTSDINRKTNTEELLQWAKSSRNDLDLLLLQYKAILFRDFSFSSPQDFDEFLCAMDYKVMDYIGGAAVRTQLTSRVFTANESPASEKIPFHHEMAQIPEPPTHIMFFCEIEPEEGGETPILPSSEICRIIKESYPEFMNKLEREGLKYIRVMPEDDDPTSAIGRGWKSTFLTTTREGAEAALLKLGSEWEWLPNGDLKTITATIPGIRYDEGIHRTNEATFFNSIVAAFAGWNDSRNNGETSVLFGDGSYCDPKIMEFTLNKMYEISVAFQWKKGDVLLLDNRTTMHARKPFTGPRRILASIAKDPTR